MLACLPCRLSMSHRSPLYLSFLAPAWERFAASRPRPSSVGLSSKRPGRSSTDFATSRCASTSFAEKDTEFIPLRLDPNNRTRIQKEQFYNRQEEAWKLDAARLSAPAWINAEELAVAQMTIRIAQHDQAMLKELVTPGIERSHRAAQPTKEVLAALTCAIRALVKNISVVSQSIEMVRFDIQERRSHRKKIRTFFQDGHSLKAIEHHVAQWNFPYTREHWFRMVVIYLNSRQLYRMALRVVEAAILFNQREFDIGPRTYGAKLPQLDVGPPLSLTVTDILEHEISAKSEISRRCERLLAKSQYDVRLSQRALFVLTTRAPLELLPSLYENLHLNYGFNTSLHVIHRLCKGRHMWRVAYTVLLDLHTRNERLLHSPQCRRAHYRVFYQALKDDDDVAVTHIKGLLAVIGQRNNVLDELYMLHMQMSKAARYEDYVTIFQLFGELVERFVPTQLTLHLLHNAFKLQRNERDRFDTFRQAQSQFKLNKYFLTDVMHAEVMKDTSFSWGNVKAIYFRHFDSGPMATLGLVPENPLDIHNANLMEPDEVTIGVLASAYCQHTQSRSKLWRLYERFCEVVADKDHKQHLLFRRCGAVVMNSIALALSRTSYGMKYAVQILHDGIQPRPLITPTIHTWNIVLNALTRQCRMTDAEKVLDLMRSRSVERDIVTYYSLLKGYLRLNNERAAGTVLGRMKDDRIKPDEIAEELLESVKNRDEFAQGVQDSFDIIVNESDYGEAETEGNEPSIGDVLSVDEDEKEKKGRMSRVAELMKQQEVQGVAKAQYSSQEESQDNELAAARESQSSVFQANGVEEHGEHSKSNETALNDAPDQGTEEDEKTRIMRRFGQAMKRRIESDPDSDTAHSIDVHDYREDKDDRS